MKFEENNNFEEEYINRLREKGINVDFALNVSNETDDNGDLIKNAEIYWVRFPQVNNDIFKNISSVEGKIYLPKESNNKLILFDPGYPGGNAGRFEKKYAKSLVDQGYTLVCLRHNGSSLLNDENNKNILNCQERIDFAQNNQERFIGSNNKEGAYGMVDLVYEPAVAIKNIQEKFDDIILVGHSFGATSNYNSVDLLSKRFPEITDKISNIISIAGYFGDNKEEGAIWSGIKMDVDKLVNFEIEKAKKLKLNAITDNNEYKEEMKKIAEMNSKIKIPELIGQIVIVSPDDPVIELPNIKINRRLNKEEVSPINIYPQTTAKTLIIKDKTGQGQTKQHSMLWISPETILRAIEMKVSSRGPHYFELNGSGQVKKG